MLLMLAWSGWLVGVVTVLFLVVCVMMVLTVLIQRPQGGGLSGAFGSGAGSGQTAFGAKTGDALTIFTIIVFVLFLGFAITLNYGYRPPEAEAGVPQAESAPGQPAPETGGGAAPAPETGAPAEVKDDQAPKGQTEPPGAPSPTPPAPSATPPVPPATPPESPK